MNVTEESKEFQSDAQQFTRTLIWCKLQKNQKTLKPIFGTNLGNSEGGGPINLRISETDHPVLYLTSTFTMFPIYSISK